MTPARSAPLREDRRGQVFSNPVTLERVVLLTDPDTHPEQVFVGELSVQPTGRVAVPHRHPTSTERFAVVQGRVGFRIEDDERVLGPGEGAHIPAGAVHDWWQVGDEAAQLLVEVAPGARFAEMVGTMFGLARDGKVDRRGLPRPLQLAVTGSAYRDAMVVMTPPPWVQRILFTMLAPLGHALGQAAGVRPVPDLP